MKEYIKKIILLITLCVVTLVALVVALKINYNKNKDKLSKSKIGNYLTEIKYEEISTHVVEQPNSVIYVLNSSEEETINFDKIFIPVIKKYNLENDIIYINLNNAKILDPVYQNAPEFVFYESGNMSEMVDLASVTSSDDIIKLLKERGVISD